jgi:hypothetical protein
MKNLGLIIVGGILLLSSPVFANPIDLDPENILIFPSSIDLLSEDTNSSSSSISVGGGDGIQHNRSMLSLARADLIQPHTLQIEANINNRPVRLSKAVITLNGRVVKTIANSSLSLNLSPLLKTGRNVIDISATSPLATATISTRLVGPSANINSQSAGYGTSKQQIIINVK